MILCDMDGVLATGPGRDTMPGEPIYRTFARAPEELERIGAAGIPLHVVTAKVESEAAQVLEAIGLDAHIASVIGANRLFWPTVWAAVRRRRLPSSLVKSVYRTVLPARQGGWVVMLEDRRENLREMLAAGAIDFGILVPPISVSEGRVVQWFDLDLALRLARELATGGPGALDLSGLGVSLRRWNGDATEEIDAEDGRAMREGERYLIRLPSLSFAASSGPTLERLDTGRVLTPGRANVVTTVRAGRRAVRRIVGRMSGSRS